MRLYELYHVGLGRLIFTFGQILLLRVPNWLFSLPRWSCAALHPSSWHTRTYLAHIHLSGVSGQGGLDCGSFKDSGRVGVCVSSTNIRLACFGRALCRSPLGTPLLDAASIPSTPCPALGPTLATPSTPPLRPLFYPRYSPLCSSLTLSRFLSPLTVLSHHVLPFLPPGFIGNLIRRLRSAWDWSTILPCHSAPLFASRSYRPSILPCSGACTPLAWACGRLAPRRMYVCGMDHPFGCVIYCGSATPLCPDVVYSCASAHVQRNAGQENHLVLQPTGRGWNASFPT